MNISQEKISVKRRLLASLLCILLTLSVLSLPSCAKNDVVMSYEGVEIDEQTYCFWFSYYKMQAMSAFGISGRSDKAEFWQSEIADGVTYGEYLTTLIDDRIKAKVISAYLYDSLDTPLPDYATEEIDEYMSAMLDYVAFGDMSEFEAVAEKYHTSYEAVKKAAELDYKAELLFALTYGDGSYVSDEQKNEYYEHTFHRVKSIYINTNSKQVTEDGKTTTVYLTEEEIAEKLYFAENIEKKLAGGVDYAEFEHMLSLYSDDTASTHYENGFYLSATTDYPVPELVTAALSLEVGEYAKIESEYGIHFILKYPLDEKAYEKEENTDWFGDLEADAAMAQFDKVILEHIGKVKVNETVKSKWTIENVKYNYEINPMIKD